MSVIRRRSPVAADADRTRLGSAGRRSRGRPTSWAARAVRGSLIVAAGTAALALAGPFALRPFTDVAGAAGEVSVAFVLDFGGSPAREVTGCVSVPATDSRYDALSAFTAERGLSAPTYAPSGLLCSINGDPGSGCGQSVAGGYIYWSYFTGGTGSWTYADTGAFGTVTTGDVEGWRFQDPGTGRPNDPPPRSAPRYNALCLSTNSTTTTTVPVATGGVVGGDARAAGGTAAGKTHPRAAARTKTSKTSKTRDTGTPASSSTTTTSTYPADTTTSLPDISIPPDPEVGAATVAKHVAPGAGPDPLIVGGLLVAALAIAAFARWRKRPRTP